MGALISDADYDTLITAAGGGEVATIGAASVPCIIGAQDSDELPDKASRKAWGLPITVTTGALFVTVRTGALVGLTTGATVTLRGATYRIDHVARVRSGDLTQFLAYLQP